MFPKNEQLIQENERLKQDNAELAKQLAAKQHELDTVELRLYKEVFSKIVINLEGSVIK